MALWAVWWDSKLVYMYVSPEMAFVLLIVSVSNFKVLGEHERFHVISPFRDHIEEWLY